MMKGWHLISLLLLLQLLVTLPVGATACSPYRLNYESAIAQGVIKRPSLVQGALQSWQLFQIAMRHNDRVEAASRAAQSLVIIAEAEGLRQADLARQQIEIEMTNYYDQPVEVAMPMFTVILANSTDSCPIRLNPRYS